MPELKVIIDIEFLCKCGQTLDMYRSAFNGTVVTLEPCEACGLEKYNEGYDERVKEEGN